MCPFSVTHTYTVLFHSTHTFTCPTTTFYYCAPHSGTILPPCIVLLLFAAPLTPAACYHLPAFTYCITVLCALSATTIPFVACFTTCSAPLFPFRSHQAGTCCKHTTVHVRSHFTCLYTHIYHHHTISFSLQFLPDSR